MTWRPDTIPSLWALLADVESRALKEVARRWITPTTNLLRGGIHQPGGTWADFGAGTSAFTLALAELVGPGLSSTPSTATRPHCA
jgi:hypothetical protein